MGRAGVQPPAVRSIWLALALPPHPGPLPKGCWPPTCESAHRMGPRLAPTSRSPTPVPHAPGIGNNRRRQERAAGREFLSAFFSEGPTPYFGQEETDPYTSPGLPQETRWKSLLGPDDPGPLLLAAQTPPHRSLCGLLLAWLSHHHLEAANWLRATS